MSTWIKLLDTFPDHPDVVELSDKAFRAFVEGLCYCSRHLTDGDLPSAIVRRRLGVSDDVAAELAAAGLWAPSDGGWRVVNYTRHQRSRAEIEAIRESARDRQRRRRARFADPFDDDSRDVTRDATVTHGGVTQPETETETDNPPTPLRPVTRDNAPALVVVPDTVDGWGADPLVPTRIAEVRAAMTRAHGVSGAVGEAFTGGDPA